MTIELGEKQEISPGPKGSLITKEGQTWGIS
jgi:hypothetical protein